MKTSPRNITRYGFGLTELLVSILLIATLMALLFPAFRYVRDRGQAAKCSQQLRTIYSAAIAFSFDHHGKLPPSLGSEEMSRIDARFTRNQYWWGRYYLASYILEGSRRFGSNNLTQPEVEIFNCPGRFKDGPDERWQRTNAPGISYVMRTLGTSTPARYYLANMRSPGTKVYMTEGRSSTLAMTNARSATLGQPTDSSARLRRYHREGLNLLFFDGHVEPFFGTDEDLAPMIDLEN